MDSPEIKIKYIKHKYKQAKLHTVQNEIENSMTPFQEIISQPRHQRTNHKEKSTKFDHIIISNICTLKDTLSEETNYRKMFARQIIVKESVYKIYRQFQQISKPIEHWAKNINSNSQERKHKWQ